MTEVASQSVAGIITVVSCDKGLGRWRDTSIYSLPCLSSETVHLAAQLSQTALPKNQLRCKIFKALDSFNIFTRALNRPYTAFETLSRFTFLSKLSEYKVYGIHLGHQ
jgi:hypothetical protein